MNKFKVSLLAVSVATGLFMGQAVASETANAATLIEVSEQRQTKVFQEMRHRWASYYLGSSELPMNDNVKSVINTINTNAKRLLNTAKIDKNGLWDNIPLSTESEADRLKLGPQLNKTYNNLDAMARAYKLEGGELQGSPELLTFITSALNLLHDEYYHSGASEWGNWWNWELGISRTVQNTLVILYDDVSPELIEKYVEATEYFVPKPTHLSAGYGTPYSSNPYIWESTGGNRTDNAQVVLIRGLLRNNAEEVQKSVESLSAVLEYVKEGDGFYQDGSYILHRDLPYSGTYGQVMLEGLGMLLGLVANTPYAPKDPSMGLIYPLTLKTFVPILVDGKAMDFVNGRSVTRPGAQNDKAGQLITSSMMLYLDGAPEQYQAEFKSIIKGQLIKSNGALTARALINYQIAEQLMNDDSIIPKMDNVSHAQFAEMDRAVHHRNNWTFGVAMHSDRVGNYECINRENLKGWHTADGMTYLYNSQDHYQGYWATVDAYKHAGTTTLQRDLELCSGQASAQRQGRVSSMDKTGGTAIGPYGTSGMHFSDPTNSLSAYKSWFMFDNEIIALGSDIDNSTDHAALTTIENRKVAETATVKVNGNTVDKEFSGQVEHFSIAYDPDSNPLQYINMGEAPVKVEKVCRTGDWSDVGDGKGEMAACYVEATIDHANWDNYAYAIIPDSHIVTSVPVEILSQTDKAHALYHKDLRMFAANFWDDAKVGIVDANSPMSIMTKQDGDLLTVSVSNPNRSWFDTDFSLDGQYELIEDTAGRVELSEGNEFSVDLSDLDGSGYLFKLKQVK